MTPASNCLFQSQSYIQAPIMGCCSWPTIRARGDLTLPPGTWKMSLEARRAVLAKPAGQCEVLILVALVNPDYGNAGAWGCICQVFGVYARAWGHMQNAGEVHVGASKVYAGVLVSRRGVEIYAGVWKYVQRGIQDVSRLLTIAPRWCKISPRWTNAAPR